VFEWGVKLLIVIFVVSRGKPLYHCLKGFARMLKTICRPFAPRCASK
jgi:hypothetical protein